ncbi:MAG TPA: arginine--tRNA ligase [bacterium]|nr:arginine--tRNA ligase [bacterium]
MIAASLKKAAQKAGYDIPENLAVELTEPKQKSHGDLSTNLALALASNLKKNPREIAHRLTQSLEPVEAVEKVELAGPGFINFTVSRSWYLSGLERLISAGGAYGRSTWGKNSRTQVEFVSANPTGPLTIGHGRQAVLGDTIARMLEATGHEVTREYYFNNAGRQMRVLARSVRLRYLELLGETVDFPEDHYQGQYIVDIARHIFEEKGDSLKDAENSDFFQESAESIIFDEIRKTLKRLNITFDVFYNEKSLYESGKIDEVLTLLKQKGYSYQKEGAVWLKTSEFGQDQDRVIVKSTGEPTYRLPDIAYHRDKLERGFDRIVDIFGADHVATYPDVLAGLTALGYDTDRIRVLIHQFVTLMEGGEVVKMSTRRANYVTLDELIDEAGVDVTRYFFLNRTSSSHLNFDLALAKKQSDENPVYYVQYAHARICSILKKARDQGFDSGGGADLSLLTGEEEMDLIKGLLEYPETVSRAARELAPHLISAFLEKTATLYHRFQHEGKVDPERRVLTENPSLAKARLALCGAARVVLANGLALLGIGAPERM